MIIDFLSLYRSECELKNIKTNHTNAHWTDIEMKFSLPYISLQIFQGWNITILMLHSILIGCFFVQFRENFQKELNYAIVQRTNIEISYFRIAHIFQLLPKLPIKNEMYIYVIGFQLECWSPNTNNCYQYASSKFNIFARWTSN